MQKSKIEWTDYTWNPITGCQKGCEYCYARKMASNPFYKKAFPFGFEPHFYPDRLDEVGRAKIGSKVFVCSMGELFGNRPDWTERVLYMIKIHPEVTFQLLTKQPQNLAQWSPFPKNCWVGVSADTKLRFLTAMHYMADVKASVKFVSFEPLLESMSSAQPIEEHLRNGGINWIIIGQQTPVSPKTSPKVEWIQEIVEAADKAKIPVFLKYNLVGTIPIEEPFYTKYPWCIRQEFPKTGDIS